MKVFLSISILLLLCNFESMYFYLCSLAKGSHKFGARMSPSPYSAKKKDSHPYWCFSICAPPDHNGTKTFLTLNFNTYFYWFKAHILWEGHEIFKITLLFLMLLSNFKKEVGDFAKKLWLSHKTSTLLSHAVFSWAEPSIIKFELEKFLLEQAKIKGFWFGT